MHAEDLRLLLKSQYSFQGNDKYFMTSILPLSFHKSVANPSYSSSCAILILSFKLLLSQWQTEDQDSK